MLLCRQPSVWYPLPDSVDGTAAGPAQTDWNELILRIIAA